jgi:uncharacterized protein (DUF58 family)
LTELLRPEFMKRLDNLDFVSRRILQGKLQGERRSKQRGQSVEFADHRPYVSGDDLRFVDWNIYSRLDQLFLKLFLEDQDLTVHLALDLSASMGTGDPAKDLFVKRLGAALGYISLTNNNRVTISVLGEGLRLQRAHLRGRHYLPTLADLLLTTSSTGGCDFDRACRQLVQSRSGQGIVVLLSDFLFKEGYESGLRRLVGRHYDVYILQILSPQELRPVMSGDLRLVDIEDADTAEIAVSGALLKFYRQHVQAYCQQLQRFCRQRRIQYVLADTEQSVERLVLNYCRRIQMLA